MTFLALDVGNTRLKWAVYEAPQPGARLLAQGAVFLENIEKLAEEEWQGLSPPTHILGCIVAGDPVKRRVMDQMEQWDTPASWVVPSAQEAGLSNGYDHPARLGADRWVAMIGAYHRLLARGLHQPCVLAMVGTAVTVEAIDAQGRFLGGLILPGHGIMLRALESGTAGLHVPTGEVRQYQRRADQRRHLRHCRRDRAHGAKRERALRPGARLHHDRRGGLEDGAEHAAAL
jgi:type III pantothenate kinase